MNDLKFAFRQLLKNPGFTVYPPQCCYGGRAIAVLTRGPSIGSAQAFAAHRQDLAWLALESSKLTRATCPESTKFQ